MKCVIDPNLSKKAAFQTALLACDRLRRNGAALCMPAHLSEPFSAVPDIRFLPYDTLFADADFAIAIGGDGTILRCAEKNLAHSLRTKTHPAKIVGINTGTLGFLAAFEANEIDMLDRLCTGDFAVAVDGHEIGVYRADGIIFSTPTGSTAYALSAGGPVMEPDLSLIEMNLICPHSLFARPMLFAPHREICVTYRGAGGGGREDVARQRPYREPPPGDAVASAGDHRGYLRRGDRDERVGSRPPPPARETRACRRSEDN